MSHRKAIHSHYEPRITPARENYDVLDWASAASQQARFNVLADQVPLEGRSLLDVGCGLGDLHAYLAARKIAVRYTGVDLIEKMVAAARQRHPGVRFVRGDIFAEPVLAGEKFDRVFCSGTFNLNLGNNRLFLPQAIGRLFELTNEYVVFNLLHHRARGDDPRYAYYDPADVRAILAKFPCEVRILDDYLPNDFTVICRSTGAAAGG